MRFVTLGRFVVNVNLIVSIEVHRPGNGGDVKVSGHHDTIRLTDPEIGALIDILEPTGGMPTPL
jgi:hypothetical protein